jgi:hypothetical protein
MKTLGYILTVIGFVVFICGCLFWVWYAIQTKKHPVKTLRGKVPWFIVVGHWLPTIGIIIFVFGQVLIKKSID